MSRRDNRKTKITEHHIIPKCREGKKDPGNVLKLKRDKHDAWHDLFDNMTLDEIIIYLERLQEEQEDLLAKKQRLLRKEKKENVIPLPEFEASSMDPYDVLDIPVRKHISWRALFGERDIEEALSCLGMVRQISRQMMEQGVRQSISVAAFA